VLFFTFLKNIIQKTKNKTRKKAIRNDDVLGGKVSEEVEGSKLKLKPSVDEFVDDYSSPFPLIPPAPKSPLSPGSYSLSSLTSSTAAKS
jgi:hypothetical protein